MRAQITRRKALLGIASIPATVGSGAALAATGATSAPPEPSALLALFHEWDALYQAGFEYAERSDEEVSADCDEMQAVVDLIMAIPATTAAEFAAKLIAVTNHGDFGLDNYKRGLLGEGVALIERERS